MSGYAALVRRPGAGVPWFAAVLSRVVLGMAVVAVVLLVRRSGFGYDRAGATAAAMSLGTAAATPVWGRLADRRGPTGILPTLGIAYAVAGVALAWAVVGGAPAWVMVATATAMGIAFPPVSAVARVGWRKLYGLELRDRAFSLDGVTVELGFVTGPILAAILVDLVAPWVAVVAAGVAMAVATILFARSDLIRGIDGTVATVRGGALRVHAVRILMVVFVLVGLAFGTIDILAPAVAEGNGRPGLAGVVLAVFAFGSAVGGLVYGARSWPATRQRRLVVLLTVMTVAWLGLATVVADLVVFSTVALVGGLVIAPSLVIVFSMADDLAPGSVVTEALAWLNTAVVAGAAGGAAIAGRLVEGPGAATACVVAAAMLAGAAVVVGTNDATLSAAAVRD